MWAIKPADSALVVESADIKTAAYKEKAWDHECMSNDILLFFVGLTDEGTVRDWPLTTTVVTQSLGVSFAKREARSTNSHLLIFSDIFSGIGGIPSATMIDEVVGGL